MNHKFDIFIQGVVRFIRGKWGDGAECTIVRITQAVRTLDPSLDLPAAKRLADLLNDPIQWAIENTNGRNRLDTEQLLQRAARALNRSANPESRALVDEINQHFGYMVAKLRDINDLTLTQKASRVAIQLVNSGHYPLTKEIILSTARPNGVDEDQFDMYAMLAQETIADIEYRVVLGWRKDQLYRWILDEYPEIHSYDASVFAPIIWQYVEDNK